MMKQINVNSIAPIRVGMIGAGYMLKLHTLAMRNLASLTDDERDRFELTRLVDTNAALVEHEAIRWGWSQMDTDWRSITRSADIDLVDIATPNDSHHEICLDAFAHGKHVLCEKPLAMNRHQAAEMAHHAAASGKVHIVNFTYRSWPAIVQARQLIQAGKIGKIRHFEGHFFQDHNNDATIPLHWRFQKACAGAGALGDIGSHVIDLARFLVGDIASVSALTQRFIEQRPFPHDRTQSGKVDVDDLAAALVRFENGATGSIKASWALPGYKNDVFFSIVGDKGAIRFSWERSNELQIFDAADEPQLSGYRTVLIGRAHPGAELFWFPALGGELGLGVTAQGIGYGEAFTLSFRHYAQALRTGKSLAPNFIDGLRCCEIIDAILLSAETGAWVDVDKTVIV
ncbi:MAG: Gfo/Idh/MocA family oxidoreductase [Legionellales bacterium]|nr:Gfo/Idh/MocA family oxidoreductase [Legionellales bacterium]